MPFATTAFLCLHILALNPSPSHSWKSLGMQYLLVGILPFLGHFYHKRALKTKWKNCKATQEDVLLNILKINGDSQYGMDFGLKNIKSKADFVKRHSLTYYDRYLKYVNEVLDGKENVMSALKVVHFAITSGTTGKSKIFPHHKGTLKPELGVLLFHRIVNTLGCSLRRIIGLRYKPTVNYSSTGIAISPISYYTSPHFAYFVSPFAVSQISDESTALYLHALFGLSEKDVCQIDGLISPLALSFFRLIEERWKSLVDDIQNGTISDDISLEEETKKEIASFLHPNPKRAEELRIIFKDGFNKKLVKRLWPSCQGMMIIAGGGFSNSTKMLQEEYAGGIPILSLLHGCSEGVVGVAFPDKPEQYSYMVIPELAFYEFIPVEICDESDPNTLFLDEVGNACNTGILFTFLNQSYSGAGYNCLTRSTLFLLTRLCLQNSLNQILIKKIICLNLHFICIYFLMLG